MSAVGAAYLGFCGWRCITAGLGTSPTGLLVTFLVSAGIELVAPALALKDYLGSMRGLAIPLALTLSPNGQTVGEQIAALIGSVGEQAIAAIPAAYLDLGPQSPGLLGAIGTALLL